MDRPGRRRRPVRLVLRPGERPPATVAGHVVARRAIRLALRVTRFTPRVTSWLAHGGTIRARSALGVAVRPASGFTGRFALRVSAGRVLGAARATTRPPTRPPGPMARFPGARRASRTGMAGSPALGARRHLLGRNSRPRGAESPLGGRPRRGRTRPTAVERRARSRCAVQAAVVGRSAPPRPGTGTAVGFPAVLRRAVGPVAVDPARDQRALRPGAVGRSASPRPDTDTTGKHPPDLRRAVVGPARPR